MSHLRYPQRDRARLPGRTCSFEVAAWIVVLAVAVALRLIDLGRIPLGVDEAQEALSALRAARYGTGVASYYSSPLLLSQNAITFILLGANDVTARLWPAIAGVVLVLIPAALRRRIGRVGALAAGLYLAVSPTMVYVSRHADGAIFTYLGAMITLAAISSLLESGQWHWALLATGGAAVMLSSSARAYGVIAGWTVSLGSLFLLNRRSLQERVGATLTLPKEWVSKLVGGLLIGVAILSTGLGWNPGGLSAAGKLLVKWVQRFAAVGRSSPSPITLILVYEFLAVWLGTAAAVAAWRRRNLFGQFLTFWAVGGVLLLMLAPGRKPLDVGVTLLPLSLLTGASIEGFVSSANRRAGHLGGFDIAFTVLIGLLWCHFILVLLHYQGPAGNQGDLFLAVLTVLLLILLTVLFSTLGDGRSARRHVKMVSGLVLLLATASISRRLSFDGQAATDELLATEPAVSSGVQDLMETLGNLAWVETGNAITERPLDVDIRSDLGPVLGWYLRQFNPDRSVDVAPLGALIPPALIVAGPGYDVALEYPATRYVGTTFPLTVTWNSRTILPCLATFATWPPDLHEPLSWLLLRRQTAFLPVPRDTVVLWVRQ